jgi:23S rRNA pseudouridine1911/1915/1917 synthase
MDWKSACCESSSLERSVCDVTEHHLTLLSAGRLDKVLAEVAPDGLSRSRLRVLIEAGEVRGPDGPLTNPSAKMQVGLSLVLSVPAPEDPTPQPESIPLNVVYEDDSLIVVNKPAGMVVHPAPGAPNGTLVNALLHHCGDSLSGIGGQRRPGIVHRIDKDTSGLLVVAKSDAAHHGLARQFADHSAERMYRAVCFGLPDRADPRLANLPGISFEPGGVVVIRSQLDRHPTDRTRMAVVRQGGRHAATRARVVRTFEGASELECQLETGRTHQIRVHLAHVGHALLGDPVYARRQPPVTFDRQALHAETLGFVHPITGQDLSFKAPPPADFAALLRALGNNSHE